MALAVSPNTIEASWATWTKALMIMRMRMSMHHQIKQFLEETFDGGAADEATGSTLHSHQMQAFIKHVA